MLSIGENLYLNFLDADKKLKLSEFINQKRFRVDDSPMNYREVSHLNAHHLLPTNHERNREWRRFSFKEMLYLLIVKELRKFGFKNKQLYYLWKCFFAQPEQGTPNYHISDVAIACCLNGTEILLTIDSEGFSTFSAPAYYLILAISNPAFVQINLLLLVNNLLKQMGKTPIEGGYTFINSFIFNGDQENI